MLPRIAGILCLMVVATPMRAETIMTDSTGLSTVSTCIANGETWQEQGTSCHSDKMFRRSVPHRDSRAYTVKEIDALRQTVDNKYVWGFYSGSRMLAGQTVAVENSYNEVEKTKVVEEQVRTWMQAGKTAQDLIDSEK